MSSLAKDQFYIGKIFGYLLALLIFAVTVTALVLIYDLILLMWYLTGQPLAGQILKVSLTFFLAVISWTKLSGESARKYFH